MSDPKGGTRELLLEAVEANKRTAELLQDALNTLSGEAVMVPRLGTWDIGKLTRAWTLAEPLPGPKLLLQTCADNPDEWVSFTDIADAAGISVDQLRNEISRFHRQLNTAGISDRPYESKQASELGFKTGYWMPEAIAALMRQVLVTEAR